MQIYSFIFRILFLLSLNLSASINQNEKNELIQQSIILRNSFKYDSVIIINNYILNNFRLTKEEQLPIKFELVSALERAHKRSEALDAFLQLEKECISQQNNNLLAEIYVHIGLLYEMVGDYNSAHIYLNKAKYLIDLFHITTLKPIYYLRKASLYNNASKKVRAIEYINKAIYYGEKQNDFVNLGDIYMLRSFLIDINNKEERLKYKRLVIKARELNKNYSGVAHAFANTSYIFAYHHQIDSALHYSNKAVEFLSTYKVDYRKDQIYRRHSLNLEGGKKYKEALFYYKHFYNETMRIIEEKAIQDVEGIKQEYRDKHRLKTIKHQEKTINQIIIFSISIVTLLIIITVLFLQRKSLYKKIEIQNGEIIENYSQLEVVLENEIVLKNETHHRIKNNLQIIIALLDLENESLFKAITNRIYSISTIHDLMYHNNFHESLPFGLYTHEIINNLKNSISDIPINVNTEIDNDISLHLNRTIPIGLITNELITNSIKHARVPGRDLEIFLKVQKIEDGKILYTYTDNGPGFNFNSQHNKSFGLFIIESMIEQLSGYMKNIESTEKPLFNISFKE